MSEQGEPQWAAVIATFAVVGSENRLGLSRCKKPGVVLPHLPPLSGKWLFVINDAMSASPIEPDRSNSGEEGVGLLRV